MQNRVIGTRSKFRTKEPFGCGFFILSFHFLVSINKYTVHPSTDWSNHFLDYKIAWYFVPLFLSSTVNVVKFHTTLDDGSMSHQSCQMIYKWSKNVVKQASMHTVHFCFLIHFHNLAFVDINKQIYNRSVYLANKFRLSIYYNHCYSIWQNDIGWKIINNIENCNILYMKYKYLWNNIINSI